MFAAPLTTLIFTFFAGCSSFLRLTPERRLYDDLIRDYDEGTRPVLNASSTIAVNFSISLHHIMDLDERNQTLITHTWIYEEWDDELLRWDPEDYGNQEHIIMPANRIWVPDIYIFNNAQKGDAGFVMVNDSRLMVHYDGRVEWIVPLMIKSSCAVDVAYFPFDNQHCFVRFGSWIYDSKQLNLVRKYNQVDMNYFVTNNEYDLLSIKIELDSHIHGMLTGDYPQITMRLHIKRKPLYYMYTVVAPTLVLCIMTLFTFLLPCDNGAKVGIGLTVFLSLYVLQLAIAENIPDSNSLPLIGLFLTLVMTLNSVSLLFATLVINIKKKGERKPCPEVPRLAMFFCRYFLAKITCTPLLNFFDFYDVCDPPEDPSPHEGASSDQTSGDEETEELSSVDDMEDKPVPSTSTAIVKHRSIRRRVDNIIPTPSTRGQFKRLFRRSVLKRKPPRDRRLEWYFVASVLDKTLFVLFLTSMILTVAFPLIIIPYIHRND